jgi:hypothetical protein
MIGQILSNNNERCYNNFSPTFRKVNTPLVKRIPMREPTVQTWRHSVQKKHGAIALETIYYYNRNLAARQIYREIRACTAPPLNLTQSHNYSTVYTYEEQTSVYIYEVTAPSRTQQGWVTKGSTNKFELAESY